MKSNARKSDEITRTPLRSKKGEEGAAALAVTPGESGRKQGDAKSSRRMTSRQMMEGFFLSKSTAADTKNKEKERGEEKGREAAGGGERGAIGKAGEEQKREDDVGDAGDDAARTFLFGGDNAKQKPFAVDFGDVGKNVQNRAEKKAAKQKKIADHAKKTLAEANAKAAKERIEGKKQSVFTKARKKGIEFVDKQKKKTWENHVVCSFNVTVGATKSGAKAEWDKLIGAGLTYLHENLQEGMAILPKSKDSDLPPILAQEDIPKYEIKLRKGYVTIPNTNAFADVKKGQTRRIKGSMIMGVNNDKDGMTIKEMFAAVQGDLKNMKCIINIKANANLDTTQAIAFLGYQRRSRMR